MEETKNKIDYYGETDNYIHLKFGDARKMYNFTPEFIKEYPVFAEEYAKYFRNDNEWCYFNNAYSVIRYIDDFKIPVHLYLNYSDKPITAKKAITYFNKENRLSNKLDNN